MKPFFDFIKAILLDDVYQWAIIIGLFVIGGAIIDHFNNKDELAKMEMQAKIQIKIEPTPPPILERDKK